jgi:hypothetical protein
MRGSLILVGVGLGTSYLVAGLGSLPRLGGALLCLAVLLGLGAIGAPDWLSQALRRLPSGGAKPNETQARAFLITASLATLAFGIWAVLR